MKNNTSPSNLGAVVSVRDELGISDTLSVPLIQVACLPSTVREIFSVVCHSHDSSSDKGHTATAQSL